MPLFVNNNHRDQIMRFNGRNKIDRWIFNFFLTGLYIMDIVDLHPGQCLGSYSIVKMTGRGAFSSVFHAVHQETNINVALKVINKSCFNSDSTLKLMVENERKIMKMLDFPFIAGFYDSFEEGNYFCIVLEFAENGSSLSYVNKFGPLSESHSRHFFVQLIVSVNYLHNSFGIAHRDIKAENILIDRNHNIRLIDFGFSHLISSGKPIINGPCGSPAYASPEVLKGQPFNLSSDIWSCGVYLFAITTGQLPFIDENIQRLLQKVIFTEPKYSRPLSNDLKDLISRMLKKNATQRITLSEIMNHPWCSYYPLRNDIMDSNFASSFSMLPIDKEVFSNMLTQKNESQLTYEIENGYINNDTVVYRVVKRSLMIDEIRFLSDCIGSEPLKNNNEGDIKTTIVIPPKVNTPPKTNTPPPVPMKEKLESLPKPPSVRQRLPSFDPEIPLSPITISQRTRCSSGISGTNSARSPERPSIMPNNKQSTLVPNNEPSPSQIARQQQLQRLMESKRAAQKNRKRSGSLVDEMRPGSSS